ncbi:MAG: hypothetical protein GOMPHAMPRED_001997 [Gomphillus americanus]|uniref:tRNA(His) guanylyltransferase n=1 Tax=Gomphillus americanus TaxID=1940652 RepID=A0A8H3I9R6_9LECA|nr:MAG: hypothetical protein GOMPHAMPRED_001997 [Gomphillus americanus]
MANSKYEYVKSFEQNTTLLKQTWIVVRIDGRAFHRYDFQKPNDARGLGLMNAAATAVMREIPDVCFGYGISDEYSKLVTTVVSTFTAYYVHFWPQWFPERLLVPPLPTFDGRAIVYPNKDVLRDYLSWRQVDCHINNLYNTAFWALVLKGGLTETQAEEELRGTVSADKNEILFSRFGVNYNDESEIYKKGNVLYRKYEEGEAEKAMTASENFLQEPLSKSQRDKQRKRKSKATIELVHVDIIKDAFWEERPWILG